VASVTSNPAVRLEDKEFPHLLEALVQALPEHFQKLFHYLYVLQLSNAEIAQRLRTTEDNVRQMKKRLLDKLRGQLAGVGVHIPSGGKSRGSKATHPSVP